MKVLFDQGTPVPLRRQLVGHKIETVYERDWSTLKNGMLLTIAEGADFDALVTTDQQLRYQQILPDAASPFSFWGPPPGLESGDTWRSSNPPSTRSPSATTENSRAIRFRDGTH